MIKVLESVRLEEMHLRIIKVVHDRYTANIYAKWKNKATLFKSGTRQGCSLSPFLLSKIALALKQSDKRKIERIKISKIIPICRGCYT